MRSIDIPLVIVGGSTGRGNLPGAKSLVAQEVFQTPTFTHG